MPTQILGHSPAIGRILRATEFVHPTGAHAPRQPSHRDYRLPGHKRLPLLRPPTNASRVGVAYDERLAARVRALLGNRTDVSERRMFGGLTFMTGGNMCCGVNRNDLIVRLDPDRASNAALKRATSSRSS